MSKKKRQIGNGSDDDSKRRGLEGDDGGPSPRGRDRQKRRRENRKEALAATAPLVMDMVIFRTIFFELLLSHSFHSIPPAYDPRKEKRRMDLDRKRGPTS